MQVLRRFIARRGPVIEVRSDNVTNFVGAKQELKLSIDKWIQNDNHKFLLQKPIKWVSNTPSLCITVVYRSNALVRFEKC